ncbi:hypothetical protein [Acinetobacter rudis]|uniref:Selenocysteine synthase n=1 Tax=Acinetobacter rudis CIP 110305 TaxID=421052 RepID=S3MS52_9GAMM|nr:hypothetical protein [Acinetobacter rudis]EPF70447.1 hypothetical protein F945_03473 [Acinetobacter rudis CIP 110305]
MNYKLYRRLHCQAAIASTLLLFTSLSYANTSTTQENGASTQQGEQSHFQSIIDHVPNFIDATPTILPPESNQVLVPSTSQTQENTWADQQQNQIHNWIDRSAMKIDQWFGQPDPERPADASLRLIIDQSYNQHDQYEFKPRIRGKIKLPALENKLSVVFGDDTLDNEFDHNVAIVNQNPDYAVNKQFDKKQSWEDNSSIALRWSEISKKLPFKFDADLGLRSGDDLYLRFKAKRDWPLKNDFFIHAEQIYRYGSKSENFLRTNLELTHARPQQAFVSNQLSLTYADKQEDDLSWDNRLFRQHQFFENNRFSYGIYSGGFYDQSDLRLDSWGPFVSWRQPIGREWLFIQADLNYFNQHRDHRDHYLSSLIRFEALF